MGNPDTVLIVSIVFKLITLALLIVFVVFQVRYITTMRDISDKMRR